MKTKTVAILIIGILTLGAIVAASSAFVVHEYEQAIVTEFGKPVGGPVTDAGLHWKTPFIQKVYRFEKRLLEHDGEKTEIPTADKKFIEIDTFARWRISDPLLFFQSVRTELGAKMKLDDIIDSETRDAISSNQLIEAVRNTNRELPRDAEIAAARMPLKTPPEDGDQESTDSSQDVPDDPVPAEDRVAEGLETEPATIEKGREAITQIILKSAHEKVKEYGIDLVDFRIKSINYVSRVQERVFERMVSERAQIAEKYRAEGQRTFATFEGRIEKERNRILSEAYREAETIKGEAEAEAARIYALAYGRDPDFYRFWRSLEIYREKLGDNVSLVIGTNSDVFQFLRSAGAVAPTTSE